MSKVSQLETISVVSGEDLFLIIDDPSGTPMSKKVTVGTLFSGLSVPVTTSANVSGNNVVATKSVIIPSPVAVPASNVSLAVGTITWDADYLYITVANNTTKRVALDSF